MKSTLITYDTIFPIIPKVLKYMSFSHFSRTTITIVAHLTPITAYLMHHLHQYSGFWNVIEANPHTLNTEATTFISKLANVSVSKTLSHNKEYILIDVDGEAILNRQQNRIIPHSAATAIQLLHHEVCYDN
jgi:hypothetical protein